MHFVLSNSLKQYISEMLENMIVGGIKCHAYLQNITINISINSIICYHLYPGYNMHMIITDKWEPFADVKWTLD